MPPCFAARLIALIARALFSMSVSTLFSTMSLVDGGIVMGCRVGSYPIRILLGDNPVIAFFLLLCTAVAMVSQWVQSSGDAEVTRRRYCSTHWFFRSDSPSVWGWKAVDTFCRVCSLSVSALLKWDVNLGSLSLMIFVGSPNHRYTLSRYSWAMPGPVIVVSQGRNIAALEHPWSMMVRMAFFPLCVGSP